MLTTKLHLKFLHSCRQSGLFSLRVTMLVFCVVSPVTRPGHPVNPAIPGSAFLVPTHHPTPPTTPPHQAGDRWSRGIEDCLHLCYFCCAQVGELDRHLCGFRVVTTSDCHPLAVADCFFHFTNCRGRRLLTRTRLRKIVPLPKLQIGFCLFVMSCKSVDNTVVSP